MVSRRVYRTENMTSLTADCSSTTPGYTYGAIHGYLATSYHKVPQQVAPRAPARQSSIFTPSYSDHTFERPTTHSSVVVASSSRFSAIQRTISTLPILAQHTAIALTRHRPRRRLVSTRVRSYITHFCSRDEPHPAVVVFYTPWRELHLDP